MTPISDMSGLTAQNRGQRSQSLLAVEQELITGVRLFRLFQRKLTRGDTFACLPGQDGAGRIAAIQRIQQVAHSRFSPRHIAAAFLAAGFPPRSISSTSSCIFMSWCDIACSQLFQNSFCSNQLAELWFICTNNRLCAVVGPDGRSAVLRGAEPAAAFALSRRTAPKRPPEKGALRPPGRMRLGAPALYRRPAAALT